MLVKYKKLLKHDKDFTYPTTEYLFVSVDHCCQGCKNDFGDYLSFGEKGPSCLRQECYKNKVCIYTAEDDYGDGINFYEKEIKYCPFCAAEIKYEEVEKVELFAKKIIKEQVKVTYVTKEELDNAH